MKKYAGILIALWLLLPANGLAQEYYTLPEIREQAEAGWHETYTDKYGREVIVDIDVEVFGEESAPIIRISHADYQVDRDALEEGANAEASRFLLYKNPPYVSISNENRKDGRRRNVYASEGRPVDYDKRYLADYENDLTVSEAYDFLFELLEEQGLDIEDDFVFDRPQTFYAICSISTNTGKPVTPGFYMFDFWTQYYGMPVLEHAMMSFYDPNSVGTNQGWPAYRPQFSFSMRNRDEYDLYINTMNEVEKLAEDIPLCSFDQVIERLEKKIEDGNIQKVYSLQFGYVLYNKPGHPGMRHDLNIDYEADYYAVPSWLIECAYMSNPKKNFSDEIDYWNKYFEGEELDERSVPSVRRIAINAQTGEMLNPLDKSKGGTGDADYKGFISWEDIR